MPVRTNTIKNVLAARYAQEAALVALYTTAPTAQPGTEPGGPYARQPAVWTTPNNGVTTFQAFFDLPAGTIIRGYGLHRADGTYLDGWGYAAADQRSWPDAGRGRLDGTYTQT